MFLVAGIAAAQIETGRRQFEARCAQCHGADGAGGERGPDITKPKRIRNEAELRELIRLGIPNTGMPPTDLPVRDMDAVVEFTASLAGKSQNAAASLPVAKGPSRDWPTYHGDFSGNRHSPLLQIDTSNVSRIAAKWMFTVPGARRLEVTPVVIGAVMYVTYVNEVYALDARSGATLWHFERPLTKGVIGDAGSGINRGVAIHGDRLFVVTDHAHVLALERRSGRMLWDTEMADFRQHYGATSAPLVVNDLVISGVSGGDEGARGFVAAYKVSTGEQAWRFWAMPERGEPLSETWVGTAIDHGCSATWMTGTYDPETRLVYWTTGNPCPDYNGDERKGDNLYSSSVLALEAGTGKLRWYYQYTPHDLHDWDAQQTPMLIDAPFNGRPRKLLAQANRNGFFYVLDRVSGELLLAKPFVEKLNWATGIGKDGRPQLIDAAIPTPQGVKACPAVEGATNWMSTAYNPSTGLFYVMALEKCNIYVKQTETWQQGKSFYGGTTRRVPGEQGRKYLRALDPGTGKTVWELPQEGRAQSWGGVLSTGGGVVFFGHDDGSFAAANARTGEQLWSFPTNHTWKASPMTYMVEGKQYVAVAAAGSVLAFGLP